MRKKVQLDWEAILETSSNLPSLPGVAVEIVKIANAPDTSVEDAVALLSQDPAITGKLLRAVNSAFYAKPRQVESLKHAVVIMGMDSALSLALSFSLANTFKQAGAAGLDYELYWRRSLLCAVAGRIIADYAGVVDGEAVFLTALLQDIGMLVVDRTQPELYAELGNLQSDHEQVVRYERQRMHPDHAVVGGLLLNKWQLPERTVNTVFSSHDISVLGTEQETNRFARCVALSSIVADLSLGSNKMAHYNHLVSEANRLLDIREDGVQQIIQALTESIASVESLFCVRLLSEQDAAEIIGQAYEVLKQRLTGAAGQTTPAVAAENAESLEIPENA